MKQVLQSLKSGQIQLVDVPAPRTGSGEVLVRTSVSLISAGTERMLVEFGEAGWVSRARQQPDKVRAVCQKVRTDGVATTVSAVASKLGRPMELGYCNVGEVIGAGADIAEFAIGDRLVSNGKHAEIVAVPRNLCARVPDGVSDETASFAVVAAIGLQGIRLANPTLGERVVVTGLGLIGLLTVQMLRAQGCRVLGVDLDPARVSLARQFGAETANPAAGDDVLAAATSFSRGSGVDAVIITAATKSSEPVSQAAQMCRKRGRIVLVGVVGLELNRADFYEKELTFQVSCSYGPGRYDPAYELGGQDYPIGFVRWTEQRNFEAVLDLMASGALNVEPLITHRFPLAQAANAMSLLTSGEESLGILLDYGTDESPGDLAARQVPLTAASPRPTKGTVAFLGAGNYAGRVLIPAFRKAGAQLHTVVSGGGVSAVHYGREFGFAAAATDSVEMLANPDIDTVVIATRHEAHARQTLATLRAGKHVFCEKPLCLTLEELGEIESEADRRSDQHIMIGFNRRFSPHVARIGELLGAINEPKCFVMTVNAGAIPLDHWTQDRAVGGGRILGEACHFIDLLRHLADAPILSHHVVPLGEHPALTVRDDKVTINLAFEDGSVGTIHYLANGHRSFPKERLEVFAAGRVLQLDNFRKLRGWGWKGFRKMNLWKQDKGQAACVAAFLAAVRDGEPSPIPREQIFEVSRVAIEIAQAARH